MALPTQSLQTFEIRYETAPELPPPFCYYFLLKGNVENKGLLVDLQWVYHNRDEISQDEIMDEGFSGNDNFKWQGYIGKLWVEELETQMAVTKINKIPSDQEPFIEIECRGDKGVLFKGTPVNTSEWEYLLQEFIQGIYEASGQEAPLQIQFRKNLPDHSYFKLVMTLFFKSRTVVLHTSSPQVTNKKSHEEWKQTKSILKGIYTLPYIQESGISEEPKAPGSYIDGGDGIWYSFETGIKNPLRHNNTINTIEKYFLSFK